MPKKGESGFGRPPDRLSLSAIQEKPLKSDQERWIAISKFYEINNERRRDKKFDDIDIDEFCDWTGIDRKMVVGAPSNADFLKITGALGKGQATVWLKSMLPKYMEAAERMSNDPDQDKQFISMMNSIFEMTQFKASDLANLQAMEELDPKQIIREAVDIIRRIDESIPVQRIVAILAEDPDRKASDNSRGSTDETVLPLAEIAAIEKARADKLMDALPQPGAGPIQ